MKGIVVVFLYVFFFGSSFSQSSDIEKFLAQVPDLKIKKIEVPVGFTAAYELHIKQPVDHDHPGEGSFYQKFYLSHKSYSTITVMDVRGYDAENNNLCEPVKFLAANQIKVEHRYFGESYPDSINYEYLRLKQVAADLHHINELFKKFYAGEWVSTGRSKGGQTVMYYRYFYPNDVTATITYVAPFSLAVEDKRVYKFLDTVGSAQCRKRIRDYQIRMLKNREQVLAFAKKFVEGSKLKFTYLNLEEAFEYIVLELPFSFWQHGLKEEEVPDENVPLEKAIAYIINEDFIGFFADAGINSPDARSIHYAHAKEMGYYGYDISPFKELIKALPNTKNPLAIFPPGKMKIEYDSTVSRSAKAWLETKGNNFIHIYGNRDTWTACAIPVSKKTNSLCFMLSGKHHRSADIANMTAAEKKLFVETLQKWLRTKIEY